MSSAAAQAAEQFFPQLTYRTGAYAAYAALRMTGRTMPDFEHWLDTVASFDLAAATEEPEEGNPTD